MEKKRSLIKIVTFVIGLSLILGAAPIISHAKTYKVKLVTSSNPVQKTWGEMFQMIAARQSDGQLEIDHLTDIGTMQEMVEGTILGTYDAVVIFIGANIQSLPELDLFHIPFLIRDNDILERLIQTDVMTKLFRIDKEKNGLLLLASSFNGGERVLATPNKVITKPEDVKGMKIRTIPSVARQEYIKALGGVPTPVVWSELYTSIKTGMLDGITCTDVVFPMGKLDEVLKQITLTNSTNDLVFFHVNQKWFNSLPDELQKIVYNSAKESAYSAWSRANLMRAQAFEHMRNVTKVHFTHLSEKQRQAFVDATQEKVITALKNNMDPQLVDYFIETVHKVETNSAKDFANFQNLAR